MEDRYNRLENVMAPQTEAVSGSMMPGGCAQPSIFLWDLRFSPDVPSRNDSMAFM